MMSIQRRINVETTPMFTQCRINVDAASWKWRLLILYSKPLIIVYLIKLGDILGFLHAVCACVRVCECFAELHTCYLHIIIDLPINHYLSI